MKPPLFIIYMLLFVVLFAQKRRKKRCYKAVAMLREGDSAVMKEQLTNLIGKRCRITCLDDSINDNFYGYTIIEVTDGAVVVANKKGIKTIVNINFIMTVTEIVK